MSDSCPRFLQMDSLDQSLVQTGGARQAHDDGLAECCMSFRKSQRNKYETSWPGSTCLRFRVFPARVTAHGRSRPFNIEK